MKTLLRYTTLMTSVGVAAGVILSAGSFAAEENPLAKYLEVPGAKTSLPVNAAKKPFPLEFVKRV